MATKMWQVESIRHQLLAVQTGIQASTPISLIQDDDGHFSAYREGCNAALNFLAEGFGIDLEKSEPPQKPQTGELRLKTWTQEEIERNLRLAWIVMHDGSPLLSKQDELLIIYYQGIKNALSFLAISFGIEEFTLPPRNGSPL